MDSLLAEVFRLRAGLQGTTPTRVKPETFFNPLNQPVKPVRTALVRRITSFPRRGLERGGFSMIMIAREWWGLQFEVVEVWEMFDKSCE